MEFVSSLKEVFNIVYRLSKTRKFLKDKQEKTREAASSKMDDNFMYKSYNYIGTLVSLVIAESTTGPPPSYHLTVQEEMVTEVSMLLIFG